MELNRITIMMNLPLKHITWGSRVQESPMIGDDM